MDGSRVYQIKHWKKFETTYTKLIKNHYKKDSKSRDLFQKQIGFLISQISLSPYLISLADDEGFPKGSYREGYSFKKIRFRMPGLRGSAALGRLMYLVSDVDCTVFLFWIYTHAEYPKRPPDIELGQELVSIMAYTQDQVEGDN